MAVGLKGERARELLLAAKRWQRDQIKAQGCVSLVVGAGGFGPRGDTRKGRESLTINELKEW